MGGSKVMKIFRFMSRAEFEKYKNNEVLKNDTKHVGRSNALFKWNSNI